MASLLETKLRKEIGKAFKGKLLKGTLRRVPKTFTLDANRDPIPDPAITFTLEGIADKASSFWIEKVGVPEATSRLTIIADSLATTPVQGDQIKLRSQWYAVLKTITDPAIAAWEIAAVEIADPV